jgi:hypothetical protein
LGWFSLLEFFLLQLMRNLLLRQVESRFKQDDEGLAAVAAACSIDAVAHKPHHFRHPERSEGPPIKWH